MNPENNASRVIILLALLLSAGLIGCRSRPGPEILTTTPLPTTLTALPVAAEPSGTLTPDLTSLPATPSLEASQPTSTSPPPLATSTPCGPPAYWVTYVVQPDDTLFSLARKTGTTVDAVKLANCKADNLIYVGEALYLPTLPPSPTPFPTPVPIIPTLPPPTVVLLTDTPPPTSCSPFSCPDAEIVGFVIPLGGPFDPTFKPCSTPQATSWISVESERYGTHDLELGQRAYYFPCEFPDPARLTAHMTGPGGVQELEVLTSSPNPDLQKDPEQRVVAWNATCDLPLGPYTLTIADDKGNQASLSFDLLEPGLEYILVVPQAAAPGETFLIYYCGYQSHANQEIEVNFYYEFGREDDGDYIPRRSATWNVLINASGWALQALSSLPDDPPRAYFLEDEDDALEGEDMFWLMPEP